MKKYVKNRFEDHLNGTSCAIVWEEDAGSAHALGSDGRILLTAQGYWLAWYAFYPDTEIFTVP